MESLPKEILDQIFIDEELTYKDHFNASRTCKRLYKFLSCKILYAVWNGCVVKCLHEKWSRSINCKKTIIAKAELLIKSYQENLERYKIGLDNSCNLEHLISCNQSEQKRSRKSTEKSLSQKEEAFKKLHKKRCNCLDCIDNRHAWRKNKLNF
jgi:hypothetical protein